MPGMVFGSLAGTTQGQMTTNSCFQSTSFALKSNPVQACQYQLVDSSIANTNFKLVVQARDQIKRGNSRLEENERQSSCISSFAENLK